MADFLQRTRLLFGARTDILKERAVAVFGLGGVGSYAAEALARAGIGRLVLIDPDRVTVTNRNRQLVALVSTLGQPKAAVMAARVRDINPDCVTEVREDFYLPSEAAYVANLRVDFIIDAIDTVTAKVGLIVEAQAAGVPLISAMGTGNKCRPECLRLADIYETSVCPLAKVMRRELRRRGIAAQRVVYSTETPLRPQYEPEDERVPGSVSFVPPVAGMMMAGAAVRTLLGMEAKS